MNIAAVITEFEFCFGPSFIHAARCRYGVEFKDSNVENVIENLATLRKQVQEKNAEFKAFKIKEEKVIQVQNLLQQIIEAYQDAFHVSPNDDKIYRIINALRALETPTVKDMAKQVLKEVLQPEVGQKLTKSEKLKEDAKAVSMRRALQIIKKNSANNN